METSSKKRMYTEENVEPRISHECKCNGDGEQKESEEGEVLTGQLHSYYIIYSADPEPGEEAWVQNFLHVYLLRSTLLQFSQSP